MLEGSLHLLHGLWSTGVAAGWLAGAAAAAAAATALAAAAARRRSHRASGASHWRDCHFDDTPCKSLLKHPVKVQGGAIK